MTINNNEEWRTLIYNGEEYSDYEVSNIGRIKALARDVVFNYDYGDVVKHYTEHILDPTPACRKRYLLTSIYNNKVRKQIYVHRAVACTFIDNPDNLPEVDHINGNTSDNSVQNLRWVTKVENAQNSDRHTPKHKGAYMVDNKVFRTINDVAKYLERSYGSVYQAIEMGGKCNGQKIVRISWTTYYNHINR